LNNALAPTRLKKYLFFLATDSILLTLSLLLSFYLRFEFSFPSAHERAVLVWYPFILLFKLLLLRLFGLYNITWSFVGIREFANIVKANTLALFLVYIGNLYLRALVPELSFPRSVLFIDFFLSVMFIASLRISKRIYLEVLRGQRHGKPALIIGAGPTGERLARELLRPGDHVYHPVCYVDDDPHKKGARIHGVEVVGAIQDIPAVAEQYAVEAAIIAITTLNHLEVKKIFDLLTENGVREIKVVPHISRLPERAISIKDIHDIHIEDLLYREPVTIDVSSVRSFLTGKVVLVTGAGGSIGSEMARQVLRFQPSKLVVMDIDETEIFNLLLEIKGRPGFDAEIVPFIGDIRSPENLEKLFAAHKPEVVFHAAAYKHVPLMEQFPDEAVRTNVVGTYRLGRAALRHGVRLLVNISTDKAVNPTSVMGASKRVAEMVCTTLNSMNGTRFVSVRFGNVLASRGSVVPIFLDQIRNGGPVTVTDPKVQRYFMTIPEAVTLVFQAAALGQGGEVFVLDMGEPVSILQLAEDLIRLNHLEPYRDIKIDFTGLRPGEKLFEEILTAEEGTHSTTHAKVYIARNSSHFDPAGLEAMIDDLDGGSAGKPEEIRAFLRKNVPYYSGS
jgi:FlaA1/EpsC-like NDP-sugar epimerase